MAQRQIGTIQRIWRYPVKSMGGEELTSARVTERGLDGDRGWALRELERGGIMSARAWASMLQLKARRDDRADDPEDAVTIDLPDSRAIRVTDPAAPSILSDLLGRRIKLEKVRRERPTAQEIEAVIRGDAYPPSRDFFDEDVIHILASGTLAHLRTLKPDSDFDQRRFRANLLVDTGAEADGFIEDRWLDGRLLVGAELKIIGMRPAIRCVMTTHGQPGLPRDISILRTAAQQHGAYVGVFASVAQAGVIRLGDPVILER